MSEHVKAQALRFLRVLGYALAVQAVGLQHWPGWAGLWALLPAVGETVLRELMPVKAIPAISSVLAPVADGDSTVRTHPGTGVPMQAVEVEATADGTFSAVTISTPPAAGQAPGVQITPEG